MSGGGKCLVCKISALVAALGAIGWGVMAFLDLNLVSRIAGNRPKLISLAYAVVAIAGVLTLLSLCNVCPCTKKGCETK